jgi:paraquat-inducible protein A
MADLLTHHHDLVACHACDLLQRLPPERQDSTGRVRCRRCGSVLHYRGRDPVTLPLALGLTALILFVVSNSFPLLEFAIQGRQDSTYLLAGIRQLFLQGMPLLAAVVMFTTLLAPLLQIGLLIYIYLPLVFGRRPPAFVPALRLVQAVLPWSMLEIFLLGVVVAAVKLAEAATIVPGPAALALGVLVLVLAAASTQVHPRRLWDRVA